MLYSPGSEVVADAGKTAEPQATPPAEAQAQAPAPAPPPEKPQASLAETIRREREEREARSAREAQEASLKKERDEALAKIADFNKTKDNILLDGVGFLRSLGLTDKELALHGEAIMYHLVPDKAPPDLRARMVEAQYRRDSALRDERTKKEREAAEAKQAEEAEASASRLETEYKEAIFLTASQLTSQALPASAEWFGQDHADYAESLLHTARNMASEAQAAGRLADLSPSNVAKVLEAHVASRVSRIRGGDRPAQTATPSSTPNPPSQRGQQASTAPPSQPTGPLSDAERIRRATAVAFREPG